MYNKATKYLEKGNYKKAIQFFKKEPLDFKEKYLNMGNAYKLIGDNNSAYKCYMRAASLEVPFIDGKYGEYTLALNNLGLLEYINGNDSLAISFYTAALTLDPLYYEAIWNYSNALLRSSNCLVGWDMYEYRLKRSNVKIDNSVARWDGSPGDTILVITEQGIGDKIMFGRYLKLLEKYFKKVVILCHESLDCIYSDYECVRSSLGFNVSIPICSLAGIFGIVDGKWLTGVAHEFSGYNIGCVWSGSSTHLNNANRSCSGHNFLRLSSYGNLYSLSPDADEIKGIIPLRPKTWSETISYVLGLDLVVSVDTSIVHLCGSLGVPCIMIQPLQETDFRWGTMVNGEYPKIWYDSVTIVSNNGWAEAFSKVIEIKDKNVQRS